MKVYLDACCLRRLTDDQSQLRIREEAEAIEKIFFKVERGLLELVSSEALEDEVRRNPNMEQQTESEALISMASTTIVVDSDLTRRARRLASLGYGPYDALHLASAEFAEADVLLTTDDQFEKRAASGIGKPRIPVRNPVSWIQEQS